MSEPGGPGAVVRDAAKRRDERRAALHVTAGHARFAFVNDRFIKAGTAAACLIDHVAGNAMTNEVGIPALTSVWCRFETSASVGGPVHHDHRPAAAIFLLWDLELHVHLANGDLL